MQCSGFNMEHSVLVNSTPGEVHVMRGQPEIKLHNAVLNTETTVSATGAHA